MNKCLHNDDTQSTYRVHCIFYEYVLTVIGETLSSNTTVEQLGATPGQAIELQVHLPPPISVDPQPHVAAVSSAHGGEGGGGGGGVYDMGRSSSSTEGMYRLPGSIIVEVKAGECDRFCQSAYWSVCIMYVYTICVSHRSWYEGGIGECGAITDKEAISWWIPSQGDRD